MEIIMSNSYPCCTGLPGQTMLDHATLVVTNEPIRDKDARYISIGNRMTAACRA